MRQLRKASAAYRLPVTTGPPSMQPKPGRVFDERAGAWTPWQAAGGITMADFMERLHKNAEKVGTQLIRNVGLVGSSLYAVAKQTTDELRKRGGQ